MRLKNNMKKYEVKRLFRSENYLKCLLEQEKIKKRKRYILPKIIWRHASQRRYQKKYFKFN